jgi:hypothetical protein
VTETDKVGLDTYFGRYEIGLGHGKDIGDRVSLFPDMFADDSGELEHVDGLWAAEKLG